MSTMQGNLRVDRASRSEVRVALYFDPATPHFLNDRLFDRTHAAHAGDQILAPYAHMKEYLNARGVEVHTADYIPANTDSSCRNIYVTSGMTRYRRLGRRKDTVLSAFFAFECPTVEPGLYRELKHAQHTFKRVYSWSDSASLEPFVGGSLRCLPLRWPQSFDDVHVQIWQNTNRGFLVMLNGNKRPRYQAKHCRELYSERLNAVDYFAQTNDIDLYGFGWDRDPMMVGRAFVPGTFGKFPMPGAAQRIQALVSRLWSRRRSTDPRLIAARQVYKGFAQSKSATLGRYKFSLCFENSILKGWVTEKIFDCFFAGTVPVYWGAPDIQDYIPQECYVDMHRFADWRELKCHLKAMTEREIVQYKEAARDFLHSPQYKPFTKEAFAELLARIIEEDAGVDLTEHRVVHA